jgi:uncharacterized protein (DUF1697 family)
MTQVAFLRAINVGGRAVVRMADVQRAFEAAGCSSVKTFIASGNILFEAPAVTDALRARIAANVGRLLGAEPVIVYRSMGDLERLVRAAPFGAMAGDARLKLYVAFAADKTKQRPRFPLVLPTEELEAIGMKNRDVLIVSRRKPNGMYGFPNNWIEKALGITSTARNWSTVSKIVDLARKTTGGPERARPRTRA